MRVEAGEEDCVLALEDVGNPHISGAIVRSCAHWREEAVVQDAGVLESGAAIRTAEGVRSMLNRSPATALSIPSISSAKRATRLSPTSSHNGTPLFKAELPKKGWCWR